MTEPRATEHSVTTERDDQPPLRRGEMPTVRFRAVCSCGEISSWGNSGMAAGWEGHHLGKDGER